MIAPEQIRICAFSYYFPPHFSGAGLYALTLAKAMAKHGVRVIFVTVDGTKLPRKETVQGFEVYRIADGPRKHGEFILWWNLWRALRPLKERFDIIHAFGSTYRNSAVGCIAKLLGRKSLTTVSMAQNDLYPIGRTAVGQVQAFLLGYVDRYVSLSHQISEEIKGLPLDAKKAVEIPQAVDCERFRPADRIQKQLLRKELGLPGENIALYVGVFDSRKNVEWLVKLWARRRDLCSDWRLVLVGPVSRDRRDAGLRGKLQTFVSEQGLTDRILFRDFAPRVEEYYRAADIFILPSQNEGMPNVVVEAMGSGLPCVVTSISGTTDLIEHERSGMLFEVNSEESFFRALGPVMQCAEARDRIGREARSFVLERFSTEKIACRYIDLYREILKGN